MLTSAALSEFDLELSAKRALAEWLSLWFDGNQHLVPGLDEALTFPLVSIGFDQGAPPQPLSGANRAEIRVIVHVGSNRQYPESGGWLAFQNVRVDFWVRVAVGGNAEGGNSRLLATQIASLLFGIIQNPDCHSDPDEDQPREPELARLGLTHLRARMPSLVPMEQYAARLITCTGLLLYTIASATATGSTPRALTTTAAEQNIAFVLDTACLSGRYLLGHYRWTPTMRLIYASVHAKCSQGGATVLTLEIDGVLSSHTLTIPEGEKDEDAFVETDLDVELLGMHELRWQVTESPAAAEDCALETTVMMRVVPSAALGGELTELDREVVYFRNSASFTGTLLSGAYAWSIPVTLQAAEVRGLASTGTDTVYVMEVDGVATEVEVTLPSGAGLVEVRHEFEQAVPADAYVRWRVKSSPDDPAECATAVSLTLFRSDTASELVYDMGAVSDAVDGRYDMGGV